MVIVLSKTCFLKLRYKIKNKWFQALESYKNLETSVKQNVVLTLATRRIPETSSKVSNFLIEIPRREKSWRKRPLGGAVIANMHRGDS